MNEQMGMILLKLAEQFTNLLPLWVSLFCVIVTICIIIITIKYVFCRKSEKKKQEQRKALAYIKDECISHGAWDDNIENAFEKMEKQ